MKVAPEMVAKKFEDVLSSTMSIMRMSSKRTPWFVLYTFVQLNRPCVVSMNITACQIIMVDVFYIFPSIIS